MYFIILEKDPPPLGGNWKCTLSLKIHNNLIYFWFEFAWFMSECAYKCKSRVLFFAHYCTNIHTLAFLLPDTINDRHIKTN